MKIKNRLQKYLGIRNPRDWSREFAEFKKNQDEVITKLERELDFWKRTFRKYSRVPCAHCSKQMHVYPYGGAYYEHEGKKVHASCYDNYRSSLKGGDIKP